MTFDQILQQVSFTINTTFFTGNFPTGHLLWYTFLGILAFFVVYSLMLIFHWFRYGMNFFSALVVTALYLGVSIGLINVMYTSLSSLIIGL